MKTAPPIFLMENKRYHCLMLQKFILFGSFFFFNPCHIGFLFCFSLASLYTSQTKELLKGKFKCTPRG